MIGENHTKLASDIGSRPDLETLGPFRWSPPPAPSWNLVDSDNAEIGSRDFAGRPHIIIFYLGHGCLHCAEQLQKFGPHVGEFEAAGIEMIAISSDPREGLKKSIEDYGGEMPFKYLVSDEDQGVFKKFRAFDDFENQPLHGTFLVDERGDDSLAGYQLRTVHGPRVPPQRGSTVAGSK